MKKFYFYIREYKYPLILLILTLLFFWKVLLNPTKFLYLEYYLGDLIEQHSFWNYYIKDSFERYGYLPLWNHYTFSGNPIFATSIAQLFYPQTFLFLVFPVDILFSHLFILNFFLGGLFMFLLMRALKLDEFSSFVAAVVYIFNARTVAYIPEGLVNMMPVLILTPLIFLFSELAIQKKRFFYGLIVAIFIALQTVGTHTQFLIYIYLFLFLYFLFRGAYIFKADKNFNSLFKYTLIFASIVLFSLLLSSIQLIPTFELSKYHMRSAGIDYQYASENSLPLKHLITLLNPTFFGSFLNDTYWGAYSYGSFVIYFGILPLILCICALSRKNRYALFFIGLALLSLFLAFGKYAPLHYIFFKFVPGFSLFREPSRILVYFLFSISALTGFGTAFLVNAKKSEYGGLLRKLTKALIVVAIFSLLGTVFIYFDKPIILSYGTDMLRARYSSSVLELESLESYLEKVVPSYNWILRGFLNFSLILIAIIFVFILKIKNRIPTDLFKIAIVLIILFDLWMYSMPYIDVKDPDEIFTENDIVKFLQKDRGYYRVLDVTKHPKALPQHIAGRYGIEKIGGYDAVQLRHYYEFAAKAGNTEPTISTRLPIKEVHYPKLIGMLNGKYMITEEKKNDMRYSLVYSNNKYYIYLNKENLPRAFVVPNALVLKNKDEILNTLVSDYFDIKDRVILEDFPEGKLENRGSFSEADITYYSPHRIVVKVSLENPGFLVLSETWYPGWKTFDNSKETKLYKTDYVLRSVYLDKGEHEVEFIYSPSSYKIGIMITLTTLIFVLLFIVVGFIRRAK